MDVGLRVKGMGAGDVRVWSWVKCFSSKFRLFCCVLGKNLGKSELTEGCSTQFAQD